MAISSAMQVLGYFELPDDEQPEESMWGNPARLEEWWLAVKQRRQNPGMEAVPQAEDRDDGLVQNELTRELLGDDYRK